MFCFYEKTPYLCHRTILTSTLEYQQKSTEPRTLGVDALVRGSDFLITTKKATNMKTKFNNLMFSRFHLSEIEHLPSKKYKAIVSGVLHHFYDDQEPDFTKFTDGDKLTKIYAKMVTYIDNGIQKADSKNVG